ncbi:MAG TPA: hypothetical protein VFT22_13920 [Kofleriaceae bacterium]|nr:hypothetical protein [Kofleriaceae bacterium]
MSFTRVIATWLGRWPSALAACALLAAAVLLPRLGEPGLWEPQERQLSDRIAPPIVPPARPGSGASGPNDAGRPDAGQPPPSPPRTEPDKAPAAAPRDRCLHAPPADAVARSLTARAMKWGRDSLGDSDAGRRWPFAALGLLTVLAAAGTAMRLAGARAGVVTAIVLLSMPLLALSARMLTSEIGTACGGALIVYGLVALGHPRRGRAALLDVSVALVALGAGIALGFLGGGALLGLLVPIGAVAAAGRFGLPLASRLIGRPRTADDASIAAWIPPAIAALAAAGLVAVLAYQLYDLKPVYPGLTPPPARELLGRAIVPGGCYSWALGGMWRPDDDLRFIFDSMFEQIAYGTYPWGVLAPVAMAALLGAAAEPRRRLGAVCLAWAGAAWIAGEVFQRKVGFTVYAGFPAMAIAVGAWLDDLLTRRAAGEPGAAPPGARLIALFALLGIIDLGKDLQSFTERLTSLLVGYDAIPYPAQSRLVFLPTRAWVLILGGLIAAAIALALGVGRDGRSPRDRWFNRLAAGSAIAAIGLTVVLSAFWTAIWQPRLAQQLSSKTMFETYEQLAGPGDDLVILGDLGQAPQAYTHQSPQIVPDRTKIVAALGRPNRVFAIAPQSELCTLHRELAGKPYFVIDDRNQRNLLLSNRVDGATDHNPLRTTIVHEPPGGVQARPRGKVVWDGKIELLGWDLPRSIPRASQFEVTLYYRILAPVGSTWKALMHFDGQAGRAGNGDHDPIGGRCPTSTWQAGDYIVDRFTARAGSSAFPPGPYDVWIGFFTGAAPNWRNMAVSEAPGDMRDNADRVKITTVTLE